MHLNEIPELRDDSSVGVFRHSYTFSIANEERKTPLEHDSGFR